MKYKNTFILAVVIVIVTILGIIILLHFSTQVYSINRVVMKDNIGKLRIL